MSATTLTHGEKCKLSRRCFEIRLILDENTHLWWCVRLNNLARAALQNDAHRAMQDVIEQWERRPLKVRTAAEHHAAECVRCRLARDEEERAEKERAALCHAEMLLAERATLEQRPPNVSVFPTVGQISPVLEPFSMLFRAFGSPLHGSYGPVLVPPQE